MNYNERLRVVRKRFFFFLGELNCWQKKGLGQSPVKHNCTSSQLCNSKAVEVVFTSSVLRLKTSFSTQFESS